MTRTTGATRTTVTVEAETITYLDAIAETFEDHVSRGELVDMMAEYIAEKELEDDVFGSQGPEEKPEGEDEEEGHEEKEAE